MLKQRIITAIIGIPVLLALLYVGSLPLLAATLVLFVLGIREYISLAEKCGFLPFRISMYLSAIILFCTLFSTAQDGFIFYFLVLLLLVLAQLRKNTSGLDHIAISFFGIVYVSFFQYIFLLRSTDNGFYFVLIAFLLTWFVDTGAFFVGKKFGRQKLAPSISPNKTWAGAVGGLAAAVFGAAAFHFFFYPLGIVQAILLGLLIGIFAQVGDLLESWVKRSAKVKDSGTLLPGHGGILDRFDSVLITIPVTYYYVMIIIGG